MKKAYFLFILTLFVSIQSVATTVYHRLPMTVTLNTDDHLVIDYDFSIQKAIRCSSDLPDVPINFTYKGYQKSASLPVILQSAHVPDDKTEQLADVSGQFSIALNKHHQTMPSSYTVHCDYIAKEAS